MSEKIKQIDNVTYEVEFRQPETILRKIFGPDLVILNSEKVELSGKGENYGSTIFKMQFNIKTSPSSKIEEEINVIAKLFPRSEIFRQVFQSSSTFKKEIFFYEEVMPIYQDISGKIGERFDVTPKLFGSRLSLKNDNNGEVDEDATILLEDLKCKGYYMGDRYEGLDLQQLTFAIKTMAKFHAIGLSVKHKYAKYPEFLSKYENYNKKIEATPVHAIKAIEASCVKFMEEIIELRPHVKNFETSIKHYIKNFESKWLEYDPYSSWCCVIHGDLWLNNMMFHKDNENTVDDVKIVDFQTYYQNSPLRDLIFFLTTSSNAELLIDNFDELIEIYRRDVEEILEKLGCDTEFLSRKNFLEKIKEDADKELAHTMLMLKPITLMKHESFSGEVNSAYRELNDIFKKRFRSVVLLYAQKIWV